MNLWLPGEKMGAWDSREFGISMYTQLYLKWTTNKVLVYSMGNSARCYVAAWMGGEFGGEWIHVHVWQIPLLSTWSYHNFVISYTPIQNKKFKKQTKKNKQKGYWDLKVQETKEEHTFKICYTAKTLNATHYNLHIK